MADNQRPEEKDERILELAGSPIAQHAAWLLIQEEKTQRGESDKLPPNAAMKLAESWIKLLGGKKNILEGMKPDTGEKASIVSEIRAIRDA